MTKAPEVGSIWQHKNGNIYTVVALANVASDSDDYPPTVVYMGGNGNVWARKVSDWSRSMTPAELKPKPDANGWTSWTGGERPVDEGRVSVWVKYKNGYQDVNQAKAFRWEHIGSRDDIIAWRRA